MRTIILSLSPYLGEAWSLSGSEIFERTGGNTGNLAFQYAVHQHIGGDAVILPPWSSADVLKNSGDIIVIPLANQLGEHTDLGEQAKILENAGLPVVGVGLGAQASSQSEDIRLTPGTMRWLETLAAHAPGEGPNIGVRGQYTKDQIEKLGVAGAAVVTGCPSNFIAEGDHFAVEIARKSRLPPKRVAVTAGIPYVKRLAALEHDLADLVTLTHGLYVVQHGVDMIRLACDEFGEMPQEVLRAHHAYIAPHLSPSAFEEWCRRHARAFTDARAWMSELIHYDFVVGTRFHGAMFALQAGVPAGVIAHDSRTLEMCQTMAIPVIRDTDLVGGVTRRALTQLFPFDAEVYLGVRKGLAKTYLNMLVENGLSPRKRLVSLAQE